MAQQGDRLQCGVLFQKRKNFVHLIVFEGIGTVHVINNLTGSGSSFAQELPNS
jgi:hypothetical protein